MMTMIASGHAQTESSEKSWTMDDCIRYAIVHSTNVRRKVMEEKIAKTEVQTVLSDFLPSVTGNVNGQYSWGRNIDPETNIYNNYTTFNNYYSLYATLTVFDGGQTINRFRQAKLLHRQGQTQLQQASDDKAIEVMQKFVDVVYAQRCVELASEKYDESTRLLMKTKRMEELGIKSLPDVALVESQVAEDDYNLTHSRNQFQTAMLALKSVMNYPVDDSLMVSYHPSGEVEVPRISDDIYTYALQNNPKAVSAQMNVRKAEFDHIIAKGRLLPSLSLHLSPPAISVISLVEAPPRPFIRSSGITLVKGSRLPCHCRFSSSHDIRMCVKQSGILNSLSLNVTRRCDSSTMISLRLCSIVRDMRRRWRRWQARLKATL